ncbi:MAG: hydrogenase maturation protease [Rhodothermales bacterium]|nr:hydrogenase maturation protease [Rhodothermales bacterium]
MNDAGRVAVIGIGNEYRGDDSAGIAVARRLAGLPDSITVIELPGEGTEIIDAMAPFDRVILADASRSGGVPGTVREFDVSRVSLPVRFFNYSTHAFGLAEALEVARALGTLPPEVTVFAIEGQRFDAGDELSLPVVKGVQEVATRIIETLREDT